MENKHKYLVLDFGNVLGYAPTGEWFWTTEFQKQVDMTKVSKDELQKGLAANAKWLNMVMTTVDEEYEYFTNFYTGVLNYVGYPDAEEKGKKIAYDFAYKDNKFGIFDVAKEELEKLSSKYELILLTDNWPSTTRTLKNAGIHDYFKKVYISSEYGSVKADGVFFDYPIKDFDIKKDEAIFIDDAEVNLDVAKEKGFVCFKMDREGNLGDSKFEKVSSLDFLM